MLSYFVRRRNSILQGQIQEVVLEMNKVHPGSQEYEQLMDRLERLMRLHKEEKSSRVSPDTMALIAGNILIALIIVAYERSHVVTSKGLNFIVKPKIQ